MNDAFIAGDANRAVLSLVAEEILQAGGRAHAVPTDVGDPDSARRLIEPAVADSESGIAVTLRGAFLAMKYEIRPKRDRKRWRRPPITPGRPHGHARGCCPRVVWLASDESSFVTGAVITIDGGMLAGSAPFASEGS